MKPRPDRTSTTELMPSAARPSSSAASIGAVCGSSSPVRVRVASSPSVWTSMVRGCSSSDGTRGSYLRCGWWSGWWNGQEGTRNRSDLAFALDVRAAFAPARVRLRWLVTRATFSRTCGSLPPAHGADQEFATGLGDHASGKVLRSSGFRSVAPTKAQGSRSHGGPAPAELPLSPRGAVPIACRHGSPASTVPRVPHTTRRSRVHGSVPSGYVSPMSIIPGHEPSPILPDPMPTDPPPIVPAPPGPEPAPVVPPEEPTPIDPRPDPEPVVP